jgi:hypothetical protein
MPAGSNAVRRVLSVADTGEQETVRLPVRGVVGEVLAG